MAEQGFIRLSEDTDQVTIVSLNGDGQRLAGPETVALEAAAARTQGMAVTVMLPAREIVSCMAEVPAANPARLRKMLPFSLEDEFAGDVDDLHFAAGERNAADALAVSVIARDRLGHWLDVLRDAAIEARRICSEADAVPDTPGTLTLFLEGRKVLGRRPGHAAFVFEELALPDLWSLLRAEQEDSSDLENVVLFADPDTLQARKAEIDAWRPQVANFDIKTPGEGSLPRLAAGLVQRPGPNLLQGAYAPSSNYLALARPWRTAAGVLLAVVALAVIGKGALVFKLSRDLGRLQAEVAALCAASYSTQQVSSCRLELQRRLAGTGQTAAGSRGGFLPTLAAIADASGGLVTMENIAWREGVMTVDLITPNVALLDSVNQDIESTGSYQFQVQSNTPQDSGFRARIQVIADSR